MKIQSRDFGEIEIASEDIITFASPIYGFENLTKYVLLYVDDNTKLVWLQSLENPSICFTMVDPREVDGSYHPMLNPRDYNLLGQGDYLCWLIVVVADEVKNSTVNMKSPIVINRDKHIALQTILDGDYPIRRPLVNEGEGKD